MIAPGMIAGAALRISVVAVLLSWSFSVQPDSRPSGLAPPAPALPVVEVFPGATARWVGETMRLNGLPMSIRSFSAPATAAEVLSFYERVWREQGASRTANTNYRGLRTAGAEVGQFYYSVQIRDVAGGSEGLLVVSLSPEHARADQSTLFPLVVGDRVIQKIDAFDMGMAAQTLILRSSRSPTASLSAYRNALLLDGWVAAGPPGKALTQDGGSAWYRRGASQCQLTAMVTEDGSATQLVVHWVDEANGGLDATDQN